MRLSKRLTIAGIFFMAAILAGGFMLANRGIDVHIDETRISQTIEARLPLSGSHSGIDYTVTEANANILPDGRIGLEAIILATTAGRDVNFAVTGSGVPAYRDGAFHVDSVLLADLRYIPAAEQTLSGLLFGALAGTVWGQDFEQQILIEGTTMLGNYLDRVPVYTLPPDMQGTVLKMTLRDVMVTEDTIVARLDPLAGLSKNLLGITIGLLVLIGVVILIKRPSSMRDMR